VHCAVIDPLAFGAVLSTLVAAKTEVRCTDVAVVDDGSGGAERKVQAAEASDAQDGAPNK